MTDGVLDSICSDCRSQVNLAVLSEGFDKARKRIGKKSFGSLAAIKRTIDAAHVTEMWEDVIDTWGGLRNITQSWKNTIDSAIAGGDIGKALESFKLIVHLCEASTSHRKTAPDMSQFSSGELQEELMKEMLRMIKNDATGEITKKFLDAIG